MKIYLFIIALVSFGQVFPQSAIGGSGSQQNFNAGYQNLNAFGYSVKSANRVSQTDGSFYLFNNWNNVCIILTEDNQKFIIKNINLNLERHTFESKVSRDTIFAFNFNNIDKFIINGKTYKNFYWDDDNKVYEIIFENSNFQILKGFRVLFIEGSSNPMLARNRDQYIRKEFYCLREDNKIKTFKLKKKHILKLINKEQVGDVEAYVKNNKLSYKKEGDVQKIFEYSYKN